MIKDFDIIRAHGESDTVEFKASPDKSLASEVCAFANAKGGCVFIGIDDTGRVVGADVSNSARSQIQNTLDQIQPRLKTGFTVHGDIIVITVPEGPDKPYQCAKGFYLRSGPNSQKLERDDIVQFFQNEGRLRYDEIAHEDLPITERFSETAYARYLTMANISQVFDKETTLKNLGCAAVRGGKMCFTNAGALFFRHNQDDIIYRHADVVCTLFKGREKDYIIDTRTFNHDIVTNIDEAIAFLRRNLRLRYEIKAIQRDEILELPEDALREAVVNAVCHRDYFEKGARTMVEIFDDRVDIVTPGGLCSGITPETFGTISVTRNSVIASMLCRIKYIEQMGTGIRRMKIATQKANVADPQFNMTQIFKTSFRRTEDGSIDLATTTISVEKHAIGDSEGAVGMPEGSIETEKGAIETEKHALGTEKHALGTEKGAIETEKHAIETCDRKIKLNSDRTNQPNSNEHKIKSSYNGVVSVNSNRLSIDRNTKFSSDSKRKLRNDRYARLSSDRNQVILRYIIDNFQATATELAKILNISPCYTRKMLTQMVRDGRIKKVSDKRFAYYVLCNEGFPEHK